MTPASMMLITAVALASGFTRVEHPEDDAREPDGDGGREARTDPTIGERFGDVRDVVAAAERFLHQRDRDAHDEDDDHPHPALPGALVRAGRELGEAGVGLELLNRQHQPEAELAPEHEVDDVAPVAVPPHPPRGDSAIHPSTAHREHDQCDPRTPPPGACPR